jgi:steroid delta-isomerase-like uncharacterized protein
MSDAKTIVRRYYAEIMNGVNLAAIDELIAPDCVRVNPVYPTITDRDGFKQMLSGFRTAFPNAYFNLESIVAEGDTAIAQWVVQGNHLGVLPTPKGDFPPTGKPFRLTGMTWFQIVNGVIQQLHINEDTLGMMGQLGLLQAADDVAAAPDPAANKAIVQRYFNDIMSQGNLTVIDELMTDDFQIKISSLHEPFRGRDGMKQFVTGLRTAFPDITFTVEAIAAEGDRVVARFSSLSTHKAEFAGIPATNKQVKDQGTDLFHCTNGKLSSILVHENALGLMQQLGVIPE